MDSDPVFRILLDPADILNSNKQDEKLLETLVSTIQANGWSTYFGFFFFIDKQ